MKNDTVTEVTSPPYGAGNYSPNNSHLLVRIPKAREPRRGRTAFWGKVSLANVIGRYYPEGTSLTH